MLVLVSPATMAMRTARQPVLILWEASTTLQDAPATAHSATHTNLRRMAVKVRNISNVYIKCIF